MTKEYKKNKKGYFRYAKDRDGRLRFEHCIVWESANGPIPANMCIHHKDHNKSNNDLSNLQLVTNLEHKRIHSGCRLVDGEWEKPCKICLEYKKCNKDNWYYSRGWINGRICKKCYIVKSIATRKLLIINGWKRKNYPSKKADL